MIVYGGTSGFSYKEWKGSFYPGDLPAAKMLSFYASKLPCVEINNTFYRMPKPELLAKWAEETAPGFRFVLKAPRRITHSERLHGSEQSVSQLFDVASALGDKLGPVLFQLPPFFKKDLTVLREFLSKMPADRRIALEFRNPSWFDDSVYGVLGEHDAALCGGDVDEQGKSPPFVATASFGYLRLRKSDYAPGELESWAERVTSQRWTETFAFLKHEKRGPELANRFISLCAARPVG
jgi:uncharacterized protein YecE (DUF72 family)